MKISIIFKNISDKKTIEFDTEQLAKNFVRILKSEQQNSPDLSLLDIYYPEDLNGYIESVLDNECIDNGFYYEYNKDVEKLIEETAIEVNDLL